MKHRTKQYLPVDFRTRWPKGALALAAIAALSVSTFVQVPEEAVAVDSVYTETTDPGMITDPDTQSVELGVRFTSEVDISVIGLRFYKGPENTGTHTGTLWNSSRQALARVTFTDETASGWQEAKFAEPVTVEAGTDLVASYLAPEGQYSADTGGFDSEVSDGVVTFPEGAGVYTYRPGRFPSQNYENSSYYVDILYTELGETPAEPTTPTPEPTTPAPPVDTPTTPPASGAVLDLPREAWWGGPSYYSAFANANAAGWDDPSFFPISVFFGKPEHSRALAAMGINTYMGAEHDGSNIKAITNQGISVIAQDEWSSKEVGNDPLVVGWHVSDECDMGLGDCASPLGEYGSLAVQQRHVAEARAKNDGRFVQANFGNGVLGTYWASETMDDHLGLVDVSSVDKYAYTSSHVQGLLRSSPTWPAGKATASASAYGWLQDQMETFMSPAASKPNWVFVETAMPYLIESDSVSISGEQIEGAVWNGIIHGAAGIAYFQHNNNETCGNYSLLQCGTALQDKVTAVDAQVKSLAPVINTQSYLWNFGPKLETSLKTLDGSAYIFAMTDGSTGNRTFALPDGLTGDVEVVGEGRTIAVAGGSFTDSFASEHTHHIYRIALG